VTLGRSAALDQMRARPHAPPDSVTPWAAGACAVPALSGAFTGSGPAPCALSMLRAPGRRAHVRCPLSQVLSQDQVRAAVSRGQVGGSLGQEAACVWASHTASRCKHLP